MSAHHGLQQNRFELKYIIPPRLVGSIRDYLRSYLRLDEFANPRLDNAYPIHSVYLDGPGLPLANGTLDGLKNRFKLRVRYYNDDPATPVFFEIKRRVNDAILKQRCAVRRDRAARLLAGQWPEPDDLLNPANPKHLSSLQHFCELRDRVGAQGRCVVSYLREAWVTPDNNSVRVTFDRNLVSTPFHGQLVCGDVQNGHCLDVGGTVLELKFTDRFPVWMRNLVHIFNLQRTSMPKYVECLCALTPAPRRADLAPASELKALGGLVARRDQQRKDAPGTPHVGASGLRLAF